MVIPVPVAVCILTAAILCGAGCSAGPKAGTAGRLGAARAMGPLKVDRQNPRYFADPSGKAVYLTGAHTWPTLQDFGDTNPPPVFDFDGWLDLMERHHHNFLRLWTVEYSGFTNSTKEKQYCRPSCFAGPARGWRVDGGPKYDLTRYDAKYFQRLRQRVAAARSRGIYVSVMLFDGWALQNAPKPGCWTEHPMNRANNINGIDGDPDGDGRGLDVNTMHVPALTRVQEAYVRKVIDTVNDLDNVLFEICNEAGDYSTAWQYHMIRFIKDYEKGKPLQHPVGMTFQFDKGRNATLFESPADWVSPGPEGGYMMEVPAADGPKVILSDTDHLWGMGGDRIWVWKSFMRGLNPIFMDDPAGRPGTPPQAQMEEVRVALGQTQNFALRMNMTRMIPQGKDVCSTGYCLADVGREYLIYRRPKDKEDIRLTLPRAGNNYAVEWFNPATGETTKGRAVEVKGREGAGTLTFTPAFAEAVLYLKLRG